MASRLEQQAERDGRALKVQEVSQVESGSPGVPQPHAPQNARPQVQVCEGGAARGLLLLKETESHRTNCSKKTELRRIHYPKQQTWCYSQLDMEIE